MTVRVKETKAVDYFINDYFSREQSLRRGIFTRNL